MPFHPHPFGLIMPKTSICWKATQFLSLACFFAFPDLAEGIGCYVCTSLNGSHPECEDPFHTAAPIDALVDPSNLTGVVVFGVGDDDESESENHAPYVDLFRADCKAGRKDRSGLFPASACVKVKGKYLHSSETLTVRTCAVDSNSLTMDSEISRLERSCGFFDFVAEPGPEPKKDRARRLYGCIDVCDATDGCNGAGPKDAILRTPWSVVIFALGIYRLCL